MTLDDLLNQVDRQFQDSLDRLCDLLKIPSISTDPQYRDECRRAAGWLESDLNSIGFSASVRETDGHPMVVAHGERSSSNILFYGHYDVQPVDPLEKWHHAPFEPTIVSENGHKAIHARGASDDKGQLMTFVEACRVWKDVTGKPPAGISILLEGEEESGSPSLIPFLKENAEELKADLAFICDTGLFESEIPAIITQLRGLMGIEFEITGPSIDLHSGMYGGLAVNPIQLLGNIISDLFDA
ncbi:MAG: M20/M25/M40 family metallo-hydrolase, partial [Rhodobacteraceae bacterium]|nr:M20/M25/M40 family metallo-hydrolase [Paracoccaceae bacterium]